MTKAHPDLMQDNSEIVHYDTAGIPLYIRRGSLSDYPTMQALCHWHDDLEFIRIVSGEMNYRINDKKILLHEGDCLMVNSRQMHYGYAHCGRNCTFTCLLFHPTLFTGCVPLLQKDIQPVLDSSDPEFLLRRPGEKLHEEMAAALADITQLKEQAAPAYELEVIGRMQLLWSHLLREALLSSQSIPHQPDSELSIQRNMVSFLYAHYGEHLTLDDIAASGNVSRSKCCALFRRYLQQSPIDCLNHYRLEVSRNLLLQSEQSVTQIATACGFNHPSYYSKLFVRSYGCTPNAYRRLQHAE